MSLERKIVGDRGRNDDVREEGIGDGFCPMKICHVDDDFTMTGYTSDLLSIQPGWDEGQGDSLQIFNNPSEVLQTLPDLLDQGTNVFFLDRQMDGVNGLQLAGAIQKTGKPDVAVILVSHYELGERLPSEEELRKDGIDALYPKQRFTDPGNLDQYVSRTREILAQKIEQSRVQQAAS